MDHPNAHASQYRLVAHAIGYLVAHQESQPSLEELADATGVSPTHLQKVFSAWAGISPKRFQQFLNKDHARQLLAESRATLETAFATGLSSGGRLHDLLVECDAVTPGEVQRLGARLEIRHGVADTPFGPALFGITTRGICHLDFVDADLPSAFSQLKAAWPLASLIEDAGAAVACSTQVFAAVSENFAATNVSSVRPRLSALIRGTNFQIRVWQALLTIPVGQVATYGDLARRLRVPRAARAIGNAVGANALAVLIPCHRVIRESGALGGYRWGIERKLALLTREHDKSLNSMNQETV